LYPTLYAAQASNFVEYLPAYLAHSHGKEVYHWFTADAIAEAQTMDWDQDKQCPISQDGLALWSTLQTLDLEWCLSSSDLDKQGTPTMDLDNITLPSFNTANPLAVIQPGAPLVAPQAPPRMPLKSTTTLLWLPPWILASRLWKKAARFFPSL